MSNSLEKTLRDQFGCAKFRDGQEEAIRALINGKDVVLVMPTGSGKSLCYQLPAVRIKGVALVISPIISLMKDQVDELKQKEIRAESINSALSSKKRDQIYQKVRQQSVDLLYVSPERLQKIKMQNLLKEIDISLLVVDEAHCISEWGHEFRPAYMNIPKVYKKIGSPPVLATTATATPLVREDIRKRLNLQNPQVIVTGFNRPNLRLEVVSAYDEDTKKKQLHRTLTDTLTSSEGSRIVYVGTRQDAEELPKFLKNVSRIDAVGYHGGMDRETRNRCQNAFMEEEIRTIVATSAFGMGINKQDIRTIVHYQIPGTLEAYYQQIGRAGRDGKPALARLIYSPDDRSLQEFFIREGSPSKDELRNLWDYICSSLNSEEQSRDKSEQFSRLSYSKASQKTDLPPSKIEVGINIFQEAGLLRWVARGIGQLIYEIIDPDLFDLNPLMDRINRRKKYRKKLLNKMIRYAETNTCRRDHILDYFQDDGSRKAISCCDNCFPRVHQAYSEEEGDSESTRIANIIFRAIDNLKFSVGVYKLAKVLTGSEAKDIKEFYFHQHPQYGELECWTQKDVRKMIREMISKDLLKLTGGDKPVIDTTPASNRFRKQGKTVSLQIVQKIKTSKKESSQKGKSITYQKSMRLIQDGLTIKEIAERRGLTEGTIYTHCVRSIEQGDISIDYCVLPERQEKIRTVINELPSIDRLRPIKERLPEEIKWGEIKCVLADEKNSKTNKTKKIFDESSSKERASLVVELGDTGDPEHNPELIELLDNTSVQVRCLAASALGKIGDPQATGKLIDALDDEHPQVRQHAANALGKIGDPSAVEKLSNLAEDDPKDYVQKDASRALKKCKKEKGFSPSLDKGKNGHPEDGKKSKSFEERLKEYKEQMQPVSLEGPWDEGWALGYHSRSSEKDRYSPIGDLLHRYKYQEEKQLAKKIANKTADFIRSNLKIQEIDLILPVPSTRKRRSYQPVPLLSRELSDNIGIPALEYVLIKTRKTQQQKAMKTIEQKRENVNGAFSLEKPEVVRDKTVLVVDDLFDSGATLKEITRVLQNGDPANVFVLCITRTSSSGRLE